MTSVGIMASSVVTAVCTDVLQERFNDFTTNSWTVGTNTAIVAARTGNGARATGVETGSAGFMRYTIPSISQSANITVGFAFRVSNASGTRAMFRLESDNATTVHIYVQVLTDGTVQIRLGAGGTILAASAAGVIPINTYVYVELQAVLHDTAGAVTLRVGGTQVAAATGIDTKNAGTKTVFDTLCLLAPASGINNIFDDLYISTGAGCAFQGDHTIP